MKYKTLEVLSPLRLPNNSNNRVLFLITHLIYLAMQRYNNFFGIQYAFVYEVIV